jgi:hypothetical protein
MSAKEEDDRPVPRELTRTLPSQPDPREASASTPPPEEETTQLSAPEVITAPRSSRPPLTPPSLPPPPPSSPSPAPRFQGEQEVTTGGLADDPALVRTLRTGVAPPLPKPNRLRKIGAYLAVAAIFLAIGAAFTLFLLR